MMIGEGLGTGWTVGKKQSLNSTRCEEILILKEYDLIFTTVFSSVIIILNMIILFIIYKTIRQRYFSISLQRLNVEPLLNKFNFNEWLVGFTDGYGTFSMIKDKKGSYKFTFKLTQSIYNYRILYYIKKELKCGSITKDNNNLIEYKIKDTKILKDKIIPIFDNYLLHTNKYYFYSLWKEALLNSHMRDINKSKYILPDNYKSPNNKIPSKSWIIGFIEAKGSFLLIKKEEKQIVHSFSLNKEIDYHILEKLKSIFGIVTKIKLNKDNNYILETSNSRNIEYLIKYFDSTLKGVKSLEFKIWKRSYIKYKGNYDKLLSTQNLLKIIQNKSI